MAQRERASRGEKASPRAERGKKDGAGRQKAGVRRQKTARADGGAKPKRSAARGGAEEKRNDARAGAEEKRNDARAGAEEKRSAARAGAEATRKVSKHRKKKRTAARTAESRRREAKDAGRVVPARPCLGPVLSIDRSGMEPEQIALVDCAGKPREEARRALSLLARPWGAPRPSLPPAPAPAGPAPKARGDAAAAPGGTSAPSPGEIAPGVRLLDPGLLFRIDALARKYPGRLVSIVSGYRPQSRGSLHQTGRALDLRIAGVRNEDLAAACRTLADTGCGYYPNSSFVHVDVRAPGTGSVAWIDASGPGEPPRYVTAWPPPQSEAQAIASGGLDEDGEAVLRRERDEKSKRAEPSRAAGEVAGAKEGVRTAAAEMKEAPRAAEKRPEAREAALAAPEAAGAKEASREAEEQVETKEAPRAAEEKAEATKEAPRAAEEKAEATRETPRAAEERAGARREAPGNAGAKEGTPRARVEKAKSKSDAPGEAEAKRVARASPDEDARRR